MPPARPHLATSLRRLGGALVASFLILLTAGVATNVWMDRRAAPYIYQTLAEVPARPVAIVPGASVHADGTPSDALADRLQAALALYRAGRVQRILVSGAPPSPGYDEVGTMSRWLRRRGVPDSALETDAAGARTLDTMIRAAEVYGVRGAIVCTQAFHAPRAVFLARHAGIAAVGLVADRRTYVGWLHNHVREFFARIRAALDVFVLHTRPAAPTGRAPHDPDRT